MKKKDEFPDILTHDPAVPPMERWWLYEKEILEFRDWKQKQEEALKYRNRLKQWFLESASFFIGMFAGAAVLLILLALGFVVVLCP